MKVGLLILVILEALLLCLAVCSIVTPGHTHSNRATEAWSAWRANPTPETKARWERERKRIAREGLIIEAAFIWIPLTANTTGMILLARHMRKRERAIAPSPDFHPPVETKR